MTYKDLRNIDSFQLCHCPQRNLMAEKDEASYQSTSAWKT